MGLPHIAGHRRNPSIEESQRQKLSGKRSRYYEKLISSVVSYEMYPEWNPECPRRESESSEIAVAVTVAPFICIVVRAGGGEARTKDIR